MRESQNFKGLSDEEVQERIEKGLSNADFEVKTSSVPKILSEHIFTFFNILNLILALLVIFVGSYRNALFLGVAVCSTLIGIFQSLRAKITLDKLSIISEPKAKVIRNGTELSIPIAQIVADDIMVLSHGAQVCADAVVLDGECEADESLITGESDPIEKSEGAELYSGSFIVSGKVLARVTRVGKESFSGKLTSGAKFLKKTHSEILSSVNKIIRIVSAIIIPVGIFLFVKSRFFLNDTLEDSVTGTVAVLIGMIPEGLVLLTGVALAVSAVRLSKKKILCRDLGCVESLARVDVLCLDKTGTLTEGKIAVSDIETVDKNYEVEKALSAFSEAFSEKNATLCAISDNFPEKEHIQAEKTVAFSSARKWSLARFREFGTLVLGAPEMLPLDNFPDVKTRCSELSEQGLRTLVFARSEDPSDGELPEGLKPLAIISLSDKIRTTAPETLRYFREQGVSVRIISGDSAKTAAYIAHLAGLDGEAVDMSGISDEKIPEIAEKYTIFGRTTPEQKMLLIRALNASGHKTAMVGDGVNDVLALREANCSATVQSGSDAARAVSQLVMTDNEFSSMPTAVAEGRRCIGNIRRSAALFLTKTTYSFLMAALCLFLPWSYPLEPIQMTLIGAFAIGIPSFVLALEPNNERVRTDFLKSVFAKSAPAGISTALGCLAVMIVGADSGASEDIISTMSVIVTTAGFFGSLGEVCAPFDLKRGILYFALIGAFLLTAVGFKGIFALSDSLSVKFGLTTVLTSVGIILIQRFIYAVLNKKFKNT